MKRIALVGLLLSLTPATSWAQGTVENPFKDMPGFISEGAVRDAQATQARVDAENAARAQEQAAGQEEGRTTEEATVDNVIENGGTIETADGSQIVTQVNGNEMVTTLQQSASGGRYESHEVYRGSKRGGGRHVRDRLKSRYGYDAGLLYRSLKRQVTQNTRDIRRQGWRLNEHSTWIQQIRKEQLAQRAKNAGYDRDIKDLKSGQLYLAGEVEKVKENQQGTSTAINLVIVGLCVVAVILIFVGLALWQRPVSKR